MVSMGARWVHPLSILFFFFFFFFPPGGFKIVIYYIHISPLSSLSFSLFLSPTHTFLYSFEISAPLTHQTHNNLFHKKSLSGLLHDVWICDVPPVIMMCRKMLRICVCVFGITCITYFVCCACSSIISNACTHAYTHACVSSGICVVVGFLPSNLSLFSPLF